MRLDGCCECGAVSYKISGGPLHVYVCHCRNCQTRSGSGFAEHIMLPADQFDCTGETESFARQADGITFTEIFCHRCHTRIFNRNNMLPGMIFLRAGTLTDSHELEPMAHIWTRQKQPWLHLPEGVAAFPESPTPDEFAQAVAEAEKRRQAATET